LNCKILFIALNIALAPCLFAANIDLRVQQLNVIYPPPSDQNIEHSARLLLQFQLPDSLSNKRIIFAEAWMQIPIPQFRDTTFSFDFIPIIRSWEENNTSWNYPWQTPGGDIDSVSAFHRYFTIGSSDSINIDLTEISREWLSGNRPNNGVLVTVNFMNRRGLRLNISNRLQMIKERLFLRINFDNGPIAY
jgi:hypothetical protein